MNCLSENMGVTVTNFDVLNIPGHICGGEKQAKMSLISVKITKSQFSPSG